MRHRFFSFLVLSLAVVNSGTAKCIFEPKIRGSVLVGDCVGVTFGPSDLSIEVGKGRVGSFYTKGSSYSGALLSVQVQDSRFIWAEGERHDTNGFKAWTKGDRLTLFVASPVEEACPKLYGDVILVETDRYCCDVLPVRDRCLVPGSIISVVRVSK
jgi:hypothetical protein